MTKKARYEFAPMTGPAGSGKAVAMDPRLQKLVAFQRHGAQLRATATTQADEVPVVAKVTDVAGWEALSEVHVGVVVGDTAADGTTVVTARLPVSRLEEVRAQPFVVSLKAAQRLHRALAATTADSKARPADLPAGNKVKGGEGVVVGIVDSGCDFAHQNFVTTAGRTRLLKLWDQSGAGTGEGAFGYGRVFQPAQINAALPNADPYGALGYAPYLPGPAHGTHVMDIAAGNGRGSGVPGVAPNAGLIFVDMAADDVPWTGPDTVGASFGDSVQLLEALTFVFQAAGARPCSINVSLGTNGGPHDGTTLVEQGIDRLLTQAPNRSVVIAAGNSFNDGIHAAATVPKTGTFDLAWNIPAGDVTENELELWYPGSARLAVDLLAPDGTVVGSLAPGASGTVTGAGQVVVFAANRLGDPNNGDNMIGVFLSRRAPAGTWKLRLRSTTSKKVGFHAWIERDNSRPSSFPEPRDNSRSLGSVSCGKKSIAVGSYDAHKPGRPISFFTSAGPTRDDRQKPEVSAPGHDVIAAASRTRTGTARMSGTSMAAPAVTGAIALLLAEAKARKVSLTVDEIRAAVIETVQGNPPDAGAWDPRYGFGRISAAGMVPRAQK
ncbi:MAG: S8 family serine peptidase [Acidimicrobiales bacterium]